MSNQNLITILLKPGEFCECEISEEPKMYVGLWGEYNDVTELKHKIHIKYLLLHS